MTTITTFDAADYILWIEQADRVTGHHELEQLLLNSSFYVYYNMVAKLPNNWETART
jgi:hypothetical protein